MSIDLSWLWNTIQSLYGAVQNFLDLIWSVLQNIVNTGQGIYAGFAALASAIWDAFIRGLDTLGNWVKQAFEWIYSGLDALGKWLGQNIGVAIGWIGSGLTWIGSQIYNFGAWLFNIVLTGWNYLINTLQGLWDALTTWFSGIVNAIPAWWNSVADSINTWFSSLLNTFRQKFITMLTANIAIATAWKAAERMTQPNRWQDIAWGFVGVALAPVAGYFVATIADMFVPTPATTPYPLIPTMPTLTFTPPPIAVSPPTPPSPPAPGEPPSPPGLGFGLPLDVTLTMPSISFDVTTSSTDNSLSMPSLTYETEVV
jgi:phage-related protein